MTATPPDIRDTRIATWLLIMMCLVAAMIVLGGATRLTNSGLSITEWKPITGALPPLSHEAWLAEFEKYKQIPEFEAEHPDMTLAGFEFIYFMEWSHRQLGRLIGLVYALPFFWLLMRKRLPQGRKRWFWAVLILIGLQGAIGWWMVASGLVNDRVDVSQYRLAVHLGMAFVILALLFELWRDMREGVVGLKPRSVLAKESFWLVGLTFVQIMAGAFVAGTHSGKSYNTWPLMDGSFIPDGYAVMSPIWRNLFENTAAIQFNHRFLAYILLGLGIWLFLKTRHSSQTVRRAGLVFMHLLVWQVVLGIWTLLAVAPLGLSLLHQLSAVALFVSTLWMWRAARAQALPEDNLAQ